MWAVLLILFITSQVNAQNIDKQCAGLDTENIRARSLQEWRSVGLVDLATTILLQKKGCISHDDLRISKDQYYEILDDAVHPSGRLFKQYLEESLWRGDIYNDFDYFKFVKQIGKIIVNDKRYTKKSRLNYENTISLIDDFMIPTSSDISKKFNKELDQKKCSSVRNDSNLGDTRDQDTIGWCFAFVAADMISHKLNRIVSASDIGLSSFKSIKARHLALDNGVYNKGLYLDESLNKAMETGVCYEENFPSEDFVTSNYENMELVDMLFELEDAFLLKRDSEFHEFAEFVCKELNLKSIFINLDFFDILSEFSNDLYYSDLRQKNCKEKVKTKEEMKGLKATSRSYDRLNRINYFNDIDKALDAGDVVGISYHSEVFDIASKSAAEYPERNWSDLHASTIVGRRKNPETGNCQYLVRNTWGTNYENSNFDVENGNIWINAKDLAAYTSSITTIE